MAAKACWSVLDREELILDDIEHPVGRTRRNGAENKQILPERNH